MPASVAATPLPPISQLHERKRPRDFIDCFVVSANATPRQAAQIITEFPGWVQRLLWLRGLLTAPFGLSNDGPPAADKLGPFPVESESEYELIAGFNDKHLDFRVSVIAQDRRVYLGTWVHPHHWAGRTYLAVIYPFHVLIARNALKRVARVDPDRLSATGNEINQGDAQ